MSKQEAKKFEVKGHPLKCLVCGNDMFFERTIALEQYKIFEEHLDVINLTCSECGYISLFDPHPGAP